MYCLSKIERIKCAVRSNLLPKSFPPSHPLLLFSSCSSPQDVSGSRSLVVVWYFQHSRLVKMPQVGSQSWWPDPIVPFQRGMFNNRRVGANTPIFYNINKTLTKIWILPVHVTLPKSSLLLNISGFEEFSKVEKQYIYFAYAASPEPVVLLETTNRKTMENTGSIPRKNYFQCEF